jgi:hypothetical protein
MNSNDPWDLLEEIEEKGGISLKKEKNARLCVFNLCQTISNHIPFEVQKQLNILNDIQSISEQDLILARVRVWAIHKKTNTLERNAIRAVICALEVWKNDYEIYNSISYCMDFCSALSYSAFENEYCFILKKYLCLKIKR